MSTVRTILACESKIMGYGESDTSGAWIKLQLLPEALEAIRGRKGEVVDILIAEQQEQPAEPIKPKEHPIGGPLSKNCARYCRDPEFSRWVGTHWPGQNPIDAVRAWCGVKSRAELDHDAEAASRWEAMKGDYLREAT